jgi:histidinol phosphatase-like enzyme
LLCFEQAFFRRPQEWLFNILYQQGSRIDEFYTSNPLFYDKKSKFFWCSETIHGAGAS